MATAATAAKQNSNKKRGGEGENQALLCPWGVFKVKRGVASRVGGGEHRGWVLMRGAGCVVLCTALLGCWGSGDAGRIPGRLVWPLELGRGCSKALAVARGGGDGISQADCHGSLVVAEPVLGLSKFPAPDGHQQSTAGS